MGNAGWSDQPQTLHGSPLVSQEWKDQAALEFLQNAAGLSWSTWPEGTPSYGKRLQKAMEHHQFELENSRFFYGHFPVRYFGHNQVVSCNRSIHGGCRTSWQQALAEHPTLIASGYSGYVKIGMNIVMSTVFNRLLRNVAQLVRWCSYKKWWYFPWLCESLPEGTSKCRKLRAQKIKYSLMR